MLYLGYEASKRRYIETQRKFDEILSEKEELFNRTQPNATSYDKERVSGGKASNVFDAYIIAKETKQIDQRLEEAKSLLDDRERLLKLKEHELRQSKAIHDRIYCARYLDRTRVYKIARRLNYSERQIHRYLREIANALKDGTKCQESDDKILS